MNAELPRCPRCEGVRFFRVTRMRDAAVYDDAWVFHDRPVGLRRDGETHVAVGHFDTLLCRGCGWTAWYARDWLSLDVQSQLHRCDDCEAITVQATLPAVEHAGGGFEEARITRGLLGREGYLAHRICTRCGRSHWFGADYQHLELRHFVRYQLRNEHDRPCLTCRASESIVDDYMLEYDGPNIAITVRPYKILWLIPSHDLVGHFSVRLCRPCGAVEWYARDFDRLQHDPAAGVFAMGNTPSTAVAGGPYR